MMDGVGMCSLGPDRVCDNRLGYYGADELSSAEFCGLLTVLWYDKMKGR
jgi:hypothetical protein